MTPLDVAFLVVGAAISPLIILVAVLRHWLVPWWIYSAKAKEAEKWGLQCDTATRLASQAATIAENLSRSALPAHLNEKPAP